MFTGLVERVGGVQRVEARGALLRIVIDIGELASGCRCGDSVAVNGVCLTVAEINPLGHAFDCIEQTRRLTTLGSLAAGDRVNLEGALRVGDQLGGHMVQGHVDAVGTVADVTQGAGTHRLRIEVREDVSAHCIAQGSIAVDGVSLTIAARGEGWFEVALIPETLARTTLGSLGRGDRVNIERDMLARLVDDAVRRQLAAERPR